MRLAMTCAALLVIAAPLAAEEVNAVEAAAEIPCGQINEPNLQTPWKNGKFGIPIYQWTPEVWDSFRSHAVECFQKGLTGRFSSGMRERELRNLIGAYQSAIRYDVDQAAAKHRVEAVERAEADRVRAVDDANRQAGVVSQRNELKSMYEAAKEPGLGVDELERRTQTFAKAVGQSQFDKAELARYRGELAELQAKLRALQLAEADDWERDRPAREAKAAAEMAELARIEKFNKERAEAKAAESDRLAKLQYDRDAPARAAKEAQDEKEKADRDARAKQATAEKAAIEQEYPNVAIRDFALEKAKLAGKHVRVEGFLTVRDNFAVVDYPMVGEILIDLTNTSLDTRRRLNASCRQETDRCMASVRGSAGPISYDGKDDVGVVAEGVTLTRVSGMAANPPEAN